MQVAFYDDAAAFLTAATPLLEADPVRLSVIATVAGRNARQPLRLSVPTWYAVVRDAGRPIGLAMRTNPVPPHSGFAAAMPPDAAQALAAELAARDLILPGWNGDVAAAGALARHAAEQRGGSVEVVMHTRIFEARRVTFPRTPPGALRPATADDPELVETWVGVDFHREADAQGQRGGHGALVDPAVRAESIRRELAERKYWLWEDEGRVVHLSGVNRAATGVSRLGPVYTPAALRGRGYAGHVVAVLTQRALEEGHRVCLYTDQANPVSNALYERIGYEAVADEAEFVVVPRPVGHIGG